MDSLPAICKKIVLGGIITLVAICCVSFNAFAKSHPAATSHGVRSGALEKQRLRMLAYENANQDEAAGDNGFRKNYRQWKKLPPEEKKQLRNRMNQYKQMPQQDRQQYRRKLEKWKRLPPEDRRRIQKSLKDWQDLSPDEKEAIRRRLGNE
jgi:hypothetical protein